MRGPIVPQIINCPQCQNPLRVPDTIAAGSMVKCPGCSTAFAVPSPAAPPSPPAPTPPTPPRAGDFTAAPGVSSQAPAPSSAFPSSREPDYGPRDPLQRGGLGYLSNAYEIDLGLDFSEGMRHYSPMLGPMVGYGFIIWGILIVLMCMGMFFSICGSVFLIGADLLLLFALFAGYVVVCLRQFRGDRWEFGDFFGGFEYWVPLFLNHLFVWLLQLVCFWLGNFVMFGFIIAAAIQGGPGRGPPGRPPTNQPDETLMLIGYGLGGGMMLVGLIVFTFLHVRCFLFCPWLIIDRGASPVQAIKDNWQLTQGHFWGWFAVSLLLGLIMAGGAMLCMLGLPFTFPIYYLVLTAAYLRITQGNTAAEASPL
jgi:hypothetical protein